MKQLQAVDAFVIKRIDLAREDIVKSMKPTEITIKVIDQISL